MNAAQIKIQARIAQISRVVIMSTGQAGDIDGETLTLIAGATLSGEIAVQWDADGNVVPSSSEDPESPAIYLGITTQAAMQGTPVNVRISGRFSADFWAWVPGSNVFRGINGALTQTPPISGVMQVVGVAITAKEIFVRPLPPILRSI